MSTSKRLDSLEPGFKEVVQQLLVNAGIATGLQWTVTAGRRTMKEQEAIFAQGRTSPGKVVSNAKPGSSAHNYGLAADLAPLTADGKDIWWGAPKGVWRKMADEAVKLGLTSGYYFKTIFDAPHVEDKKWKEQRALWEAGKLKVA